MLYYNETGRVLIRKAHRAVNVLCESEEKIILLFNGATDKNDKNTRLEPFLHHIFLYKF